MTDPRPAEPLPAISEVATDALVAWFAARGEPAYRARQVVAGVSAGRASSFDELTDLPLRLRAALGAAYRFSTIGDSHVIGTDQSLTEKAVHELADGQRIESVFMRYPGHGASAPRTTICISSQAGCAVGCPFCATGQGGFGRHLSAAEIVDQVLWWRRARADRLDPEHHLNVVFMGMGEPLHNADPVFESVRLLNDPGRVGIGARHLTVSTSGVVPAMDRMADELPQVNLAISLHAAHDELRDELVPINRKWPIEAVLGAGQRFAARTRRRVSLEYVMIDGINDAPLEAERLADLAHGWLCHVNLIPLNPTPAAPWRGTPREGIERFADILRRGGVATTVRDTRGRSIEAACGQLHAQLTKRALGTRAASPELVMVEG
ncbi:MAG TPA: 23S rRNA (adenine(2503)-C(2))-methyltransferase RlmN [Candidatus Limnocylindria bacterium]